MLRGCVSGHRCHPIMSCMTREPMWQAIIDLVTGQRSEPVIFAQADAHATSVGGITDASGNSPNEALDYRDALHDGMRNHIIENRGSIKSNSR